MSEENTELDSALEDAAENAGGSEEAQPKEEAAGHEETAGDENKEEPQSPEEVVDAAAKARQDAIDRQDKCAEIIAEALDKYGCRLATSLTITDMGEIFPSYKVQATV